MSIINGCQIYELEHNEEDYVRIGYYISPSKIAIIQKPEDVLYIYCGDNNDQNNIYSQVVSFCYGVIDKKEKALCINFVSTNEKYIGYRQGLLLMKMMAEYSSHQYRITHIILDDDADIGPPRNLYYRLGFKIKDEFVDGQWVNWELNSPIHGPERCLSVESFLLNSEKLFAEKN